MTSAGRLYMSASKVRTLPGLPSAGVFQCAKQGRGAGLEEAYGAGSGQVPRGVTIRRAKAIDFSKHSELGELVVTFRTLVLT